MKLTRVVTAVAIASVMSVLTPLASHSAVAAADDHSAVCDLVFTERFRPGFTLEPSSGHQDSAVDSGTINCVGKIQGQQVTGPGTVWNTGRYTDSTCLLDHAEGRYFFTVPTEEGSLSVNGGFVVDRVGSVLTVRLDQPGARGEGFALVLPTKGDCVLGPITEVLVFMSVTFRGVASTGATRACALDLRAVRVSCRT